MHVDCLNVCVVRIWCIRQRPTVTSIESRMRGGKVSVGLGMKFWKNESFHLKKSDYFKLKRASVAYDQPRRIFHLMQVAFDKYLQLHSMGSRVWAVASSHTTFYFTYQKWNITSNNSHRASLPMYICMSKLLISRSMEAFSTTFIFFLFLFLTNPHSQ